MGAPSPKMHDVIYANPWILVLTTTYYYYYYQVVGGDVLSDKNLA